MTYIQKINRAAKRLARHQPTFTPAEVIVEIRRLYPGVPLNAGTVRCQMAMYCVNAHPTHDGFPDKGANWKRYPHFVKVQRGVYRFYDPVADAACYAAEVARDRGVPTIPRRPAHGPITAPPVSAPVVARKPLTVKWISRGIRRYGVLLRRDPAHRYRSWEHCFDYFRAFKAAYVVGTPIPDDACLQLSFYLASWGMFRGNAFLLQKDYTVVRPVIEILMMPKYDDLWLNDELTLPPASWSSRARLAMDFAAEIEAELRKVRYINSKGKPSKATPSMILVTKILLGTTGCIPAYDRYVMAGMQREGLKPVRAGLRSYMMLLGFLHAYRAEFARAPAKLVRYHPPMKLLDMFLWERGR